QVAGDRVGRALRHGVQLRGQAGGHRLLHARGVGVVGGDEGVAVERELAVAVELHAELLERAVPGLPVADRRQQVTLQLAYREVAGQRAAALGGRVVGALRTDLRQRAVGGVDHGLHLVGDRVGVRAGGHRDPVRELRHGQRHVGYGIAERVGRAVQGVAARGRVPDGDLRVGGGGDVRGGGGQAADGEAVGSTGRAGELQDGALLGGQDRRGHAELGRVDRVRGALGGVGRDVHVGGRGTYRDVEPAAGGDRAGCGHVGGRDLPLRQGGDIEREGTRGGADGRGGGHGGGGRGR